MVSKLNYESHMRHESFLDGKEERQQEIKGYLESLEDKTINVADLIFKIEQGEV